MFCCYLLINLIVEVQYIVLFSSILPSYYSSQYTGINLNFDTSKLEILMMVKLRRP